MIYEFIATISAGFALAGIALIIRHLSKLAGKIAPKWLIPIFAGIGMLAFQIHQEYNWSQQQLGELPESITVVNAIEGKMWYRPWSYIRPQVVRVMAVSSGQAVNQKHDSDNMPADTIKRFNIYLLERRVSTKTIPQLINCTENTIAHAPSRSGKLIENIDNTLIAQLDWQNLSTGDAIVKTLCTETAIQ